MPDIFTKSKRSEVMSRIRSHGNKDTEVVLAKLFRLNQITGWRSQLEIRIVPIVLRRPKEIHTRRSLGDETQIFSPIGRRIKDKIRASSPRLLQIRESPPHPNAFRVKPDFVFPKSRLAVFVDGCFWHGCPRHGTMPASNRAFWRRKFSNNKKRDQLVTRALRKNGWRVIRIWEHALTKTPDTILRKIKMAIAVPSDNFGGNPSGIPSFSPAVGASRLPWEHIPQSHYPEQG